MPYPTPAIAAASTTMQPLIEEYPAAEEGARKRPEFHELLRRGIRWAMAPGPLTDRTPAMDLQFTRRNWHSAGSQALPRDKLTPQTAAATANNSSAYSSRRHRPAVAVAIPVEQAGPAAVAAEHGGTDWTRPRNTFSAGVNYPLGALHADTQRPAGCWPRLSWYWPRGA